LDVPEAGQIYRQLAPAVLGYLRAQRAVEPEDLLGEVFLQVARDLPRFSGDEDALRRWVFTIAHHRLIDDRRRRARRPLVSDNEIPDVAAPELPETADPALLAALEQLTPEQREVVLLRFIGDLPLEAVATMTKRKVGAVKALQHRALEQLGRILRASADAHTDDG
jgi:RNA polymerase sigma-70 factor (ECF subfamily)